MGEDRLGWLVDANNQGSRSIQAARQELARQRTTDSLKKHLEHRPEKEELVESMFSDVPFHFHLQFRGAILLLLLPHSSLMWIILI